MEVLPPLPTLKVRRELAAGGMRTVLDGIAAAQRKRLLRRLREARRLSHPNLESVLDVIDDRKSLFVITERVFGVPLHELFRQSSEPLDPQIVVAIVRQVAIGLHALHEHADRRQRALAWVHGQLTPRTILLSWHGRAVLSNGGFGELVTATSEFEYLSPEQARSAPIDRRSDVFALGLILYEGLTGAKPFSHGSLPDYMLSVLADQPQNPCALRTGLAPELGRIAMRCLEREPEQRFSSAGELAEALQSWPGADDPAASEQRLSALLAERFAHERNADDQLQKSVESEASVESAPGAHGAHERSGFRPVLLLLILAIVLLIVAWAGVSRGGATC